MTRPQFIFSLGTGLGLAASGYGLASNSFADWGLFWAGVLVTSVTAADHYMPASQALRVES